MQPTIFLILATCIALPASAMAQQQPEESNIELGGKLYRDYCASCHGTNLEGQPNWQSPGADGVLPAPPHDQTGHTWHHDDALLFSYTKLGGKAVLERMGVADYSSGMPGFGGDISDQDIWNILAFIKSAWPERERAIQEQRTKASLKQ